MLFLVSLFHLPLANATAINMLSPLLIAVLAALFLRERLGPARWIAIGIGFVGVLLVIQPRSEHFNGYALVCLLASVLIAVRDLVTRRVHAAVPSILITLSNTVAVMLLAGALVALRRLARVQRRSRSGFSPWRRSSSPPPTT